MTTCPSCKYSVADGALKCPNCGFSLDQTSGATAFLPRENESPSIHSTASADGAKFASGTILADRYRIVSLLGRGGMGEVYKAEDLTLKQIVALKFLPEALARDGASLARFQNEVRITRQISHANVCRVYDIGETQGLQFLSMEFIDGEDLSLLLRRIGRLPGDKANEIARQICAGLAAAHDNGVLHRDLKPANIMIDGRGKARVTDFGIAVVAKELLGAEAGSGTPAYMAPEQLQGKEVTQKSDIYSLGLVLYELFTGKRVYDSDNLVELMKLHETSSPTSPSSHVEHIDPLVERVIMRCLEKEPNKRPATAIQVAAALPGGDPLAAALAAGETPSPEMVAASGEKTGMRPAVAVALLAAIVACIVIAALLGNKVSWQAQLVRKNSPETLKHKAEEIIQRLGYTDPPADNASGYVDVSSYQQWAQQNVASADRWNHFFKVQPAPVYFWYRQSPLDLEPIDYSNFGWVAENDPHYASASSLITVNLDPSGRLTWLIAVPPQVDASGDKPPQPDWTALFAAAGLAPASFTPVESTWTPLTVCDTRAAWTGAYPDQPDIPIRIEAAAYRGKPVHFKVVAPWSRPWLGEPEQQTTGVIISFVIGFTLIIGVILTALFLARKNLSRGRGDRRGAARLSIFVFAVTMLSWVFGADHAPTANEVNRFFLIAVSQSLLLAGITWLIYIALEPYVRRRWPETIISWSRMLSGSLRDPLVGRHVLIGVLGGIVFAILTPLLRNLVRLWAGESPVTGSMSALLGTRQLIASDLLAQFGAAIGGSLMLFFVIFLFRALTRRRWLAAVLFVLIFSAGSLSGANEPALWTPLNILFNLLTAIILLRYGLLTMATIVFVSGLLSNVPLTTDLSAWYSGYTIAMVVAVLALAGWAFHTSLGGEKLFSGNLLED